MATDAPHDQRATWPALLNLPNQLTLSRLLLAVVTFGLIELHFYAASFVFFVVACSTDWLDGYFARKLGMVTTLGRILDPFVDKVIVCGTFIYLTAIPRLIEIPWGLRVWMVVLILARELLVTALRSFLEERGRDFSANFLGKVKMVLQCLAAGAGLFVMAFAPPEAPLPAWLWLATVAFTWAAVVSTIHSGLVYVWAAIRLMRPADSASAAAGRR